MAEHNDLIIPYEVSIGLPYIILLTMFSYFYCVCFIIFYKLQKNGQNQITLHLLSDLTLHSMLSVIF